MYTGIYTYSRIRLSQQCSSSFRIGLRIKILLNIKVRSFELVRSCLGLLLSQCQYSFLSDFFPFNYYSCLLLRLVSPSPQGPQIRLQLWFGQVSQLVFYGRETRVPRDAQQIDPQRQSGHVWNFSSLQCPRSFLPYFILLFNYYSCLCSYLLLHPCCSHA